MGAGKAGLVDWSPLAGMRLIVIADKDEAGRGHAQDVRIHAMKAGAEVLAIIECPLGKDLSDHLAAGGTIEELERLAIPGKPISEVSLDHVYSRRGIKLGDDGLPVDRIGSGLKTLDSVTGGYGRGWLISIQGLQGSGKSTLTYQWALHAARRGRKVIIVTTEMTPEQILEMLTVQIADVSRRRIIYGIDEREEARLRAAEIEVKRLPIRIEALNAEGGSILDKMHGAIRGNDLAIIDHVTYLGLSTETAGRVDWRSVLAIIKGLKKIAAKTDATTIAVGHLNRQAQAARTKGEAQGIEHSAGPFLIHAESDLSLILESMKGIENQDRRVLSIPKARFCPHGGRIRLQFHSDKANLTDDGWESEAEQAPARRSFGERDAD
jgi:KaiC/GvpD/RAD55 family RecA-like ATPase